VDQFGRPKDPIAQIKDFVRGSIPIAGQGFFARRDYKWYQAILQSAGISSWDYRTEAQQMMRRMQMQKAQVPAAEETKERRQLRLNLTDQLARTHDPTQMRRALEERRITPKDVLKIFDTAFEGDINIGIRGLTVPESLKIWNVANEEERSIMQARIIEKWGGWDATDAEREAFRSAFENVYYWRPKSSTQSKRFRELRGR
jgi:hypothetical protein